MYQGILHKESTGWYTETGDHILDIEELLNLLPAGSQMTLTAPDVDDEPEEPTGRERARAARLEAAKARIRRLNGDLTPSPRKVVR